MELIAFIDIESISEDNHEWHLVQDIPAEIVLDEAISQDFEYSLNPDGIGIIIRRA